MKPTLKSKTEELLKQKEDHLIELDNELKKMRADNKFIRLSEFTLGRISLDKRIAGAFATRQATQQFITDLKVLLNWA